MGSRLFIWDVSASLSPVPPVKSISWQTEPGDAFLSIGLSEGLGWNTAGWNIQIIVITGQMARTERQSSGRTGGHQGSGVTVSVVAALWNPWGTSGSLGLRKWLQPNRRFSFKNRVRDFLMSWASWGFAKLNWTREFLLTFHFTLTFCFIHVLEKFVTTCKFPLRQTKSSSTSTDHTVQSTCVLWTKSTCQSWLPGLSCPSPTCDSKGCAPRQIPVTVREGECYLLCFNFLK